jgi:mono/diheme cytochrome c family protein
MKLRSLLIALTAATLAAVAFSCSPRNEEPSGEATGVQTVTVTETVVRTVVRRDTRAGRRIFRTACSRCHALQRGDWTGGKVNLTALTPTYETTVAKVTRGGIAMPSFSGKLTRRQIRDVAAFVSRTAARRAR